jgi:hypothetical protein
MVSPVIKRRGRDLNPRRTQRPVTVFETAAFDRSATPPEAPTAGAEAQTSGADPQSPLADPAAAVSSSGACRRCDGPAPARGGRSSEDLQPDRAGAAQRSRHLAVAACEWQPDPVQAAGRLALELRRLRADREPARTGNDSVTGQLATVASNVDRRRRLLASRSSRDREVAGGTGAPQHAQLGGCGHCAERTAAAIAATSMVRKTETLHFVLGWDLGVTSVLCRRRRSRPSLRARAW